MTVFDATNCILGEGPLWHPERGELLWFDIVGKRLHSASRQWDFREMVSAAGWVSRDDLLIASESRLFRFNMETGAEETLCTLEADNAATRSNDGRADPMGGFWIGTMAKVEAKGAGAFYRYYKGDLRKLWGGITVPNAQCFAPDGRTVYFSDTPTHQVMRVALDADGWPAAEPQVALDFTDQGWYPDGAVTDVAGNLWIAFWGRGCVEGYTPAGEKLASFDFPCPQTTCPAFGGAGFSQLYCTSAARDLTDGNTANGQTFMTDTPVKGRAEARVLL
ncbi:SMP-30/gluconolactonase/LRE family protein [Pseudotabrizicola sediminis]|uniref:SMP-30/gluconolactonase/LRE family protein n=1 Tax=Pseudotabrizicola sediminis TaxID=2486418 RepID=A0ABY2KPM1_9RHOB|nr:SMP-30/gluconolactonase/LRE family protein [Pseudotabrizicola sediminis]TGD44626.1 SMP-30/gluconolactonase/LRE family protein [Pseudotabrizicola sediminis]